MGFQQIVTQPKSVVLAKYILAEQRARDLTKELIFERNSSLLSFFLPSSPSFLYDTSSYTSLERPKPFNMISFDVPEPGNVP